MTQEWWNILRIPSLQVGVILISEYIEARIIIFGQSALDGMNARVDLDGRMRHLCSSDSLEFPYFSDHTTGFI